MTPIDIFTANQSLQLLWIHEKDPKYQMDFTEDELKYLRLSLMEQWDDLTSPYKDQLKSQDRAENLILLYSNEPIFS